MKKKAFTLTEIIIVTIVLAIVIGLAVPNYGTAVRKARQRQIMAMERAVYAANLIYRNNSNPRQYWNAGGGTVSNVSTISNGLRIDIIPMPGYVYRYNATANTWSLEVEQGGMNWEIRVTQAPLSATNPCCDPDGDPASVCATFPTC